MKYFTHYWKNSTWEENRNAQFSNHAVKHISGNDLKKLGMSVGDTVFIITVRTGKLLIAGKLIIGKFCSRIEVAKEMNCNPNELWDAKDHVSAANYTESPPKVWDLEVPLEITKQLLFISQNEITSPVFISESELDRQTLRKPRQLTPESAQKLDSVLSLFYESELSSKNLESNWEDNCEVISNEAIFESSVEGNKTLRYTTKYERDPKLRKQAVAIHGYTCKVCKFNFEKTYGEHGKDFIHVHHIRPLFMFEKEKPVDPQTELTVLCPNCHAMIHRKKDKTLTIEELKAIYKNE